MSSQPSFMSKNSFVKFTILVVDDDYTSLSIVSAMLKSWKYDVMTVKSPLDALATIRIKQEQIDLVLTDLHMPRMNGIELQKQINEEFHLPVVIMSSDDRESMILKSLASGVVFYILKPINPEDLKNVWQYAIGSKKGKSILIEELASVEGGFSVESSTEKISYGNIGSASSVNEDKHHKKDSKRKSSKKEKEDQDGENPVAPKKAKVVWTNSLHNRFLQAIKHIGLEKAVPKKILEFMNVPGLTRENVASHLQKYRIFLKRVAEKGAHALSRNFSERALRSTFASGHSSLTLRNAQDYALIRARQQMRPFQARYEGTMSALNATNFGSTGFSSLTASSSNTASQVGLLGASQTDFQYQSLFSNTNPPCQANKASYGVGSNSNGADLLSHGLMKDTNSNQMYQQQSQTRSDLRNVGASPLNNFGTSAWKPSFPSGYENMGTWSNPFSTYAGIRLNDAGELVGIGQANHNTNALNGGYGLINGTGNDNVIAGPMENSAFHHLVRGEPSCSVFNSANYQFPPAFASANEEPANSSMLRPLSQQQYGLGNNGQNDFTFGLINNASGFGNITHLAAQFGEGINIDDLLFDPTDFQFPSQQQGAENAPVPKFPNGSYRAELNLQNNQSQNPDFSSAYGVEENALWIEPTLEQLQEIEEVMNEDVGSNAHLLDGYTPSLDENPNQEEGDGNYMNSELNGLDELGNTPENQGWDDEFINSLFHDRPL